MKIILSIVLLILSFHNILCVGCKYRVENDNNILITNSTYLAGYKDEEAKQRCYSLSNLDGENDLCCYDEIKKECYKNETNTDLTKCPIKSRTVTNNCGMAGIYEPMTSTICTEISLVQGYCCFVETKANNACIRTKNLEKDINVTTEQINKYVASFGENIEITKVTCEGWNLRKYRTLFVLLILILY